MIVDARLIDAMPVTKQSGWGPLPAWISGVALMLSAETPPPIGRTAAHPAARHRME